MNADINVPVRPESDAIYKAQQCLAEFIQEFYVTKSNPDERSIDIREDGKSGCSSVIYFENDFTDDNIRLVTKDQLILAVKDDPRLDWVNDMPWEHAVWVLDQNALQLHCAPIVMSNGESSDVFAIQIPVRRSFIMRARQLTEGRLVRYQVGQDAATVTILDQVKHSFPVTDIA